MKTRLFLLLCLAVATAHAQQPTNTTTRTLIVFFDGLRPDYITPEAMPNLYAFKQKSAYGAAHHSVFPTVTRVNASSYATGSYPATHGIMGNTVYFPEVNKTSGLNTGEVGDLLKIVKATDGHLLTAISLGELLQQHGQKMMVFSSGSTGQAFLQNHTLSGGAIINPDLVLPASIKDSVFQTIGPVQPNGKHHWVADALIHYGFRPDGPLVSAIWFSDPDTEAHEHGIGSPEAMASIKTVDGEFGRLIATLESKGLTDRYNILISTDHGFATHIGQGKKGVAQTLIEAGLKQSANSEDVVVVGGAIYVKDHDTTLIRRIVATLQPLETVGGLFTKARKPGDVQGSVAGTLSFDCIHWDHARSADILVDVNWNDQKNAAGYAGATFSGGVAGHGSMSPYEVHIPFIAAGPAFKKKYESELPTSNVDIVPTILYLLGMEIPASMEGRVMNELLVKPAKNALTSVKKEVLETKTVYPGGVYRLSVERSVIGKYKYVNYSKVVRSPH